jgi:histidinol phosphatase-like PHP family hydrolase
VQLAKEPLFWPFIEIKIMDDVRKNAMITTFSGCEASFTTISLIDFADEILEEADLTYEKA